jgi:hypothetical protein
MNLKQAGLEISEVWLRVVKEVLSRINTLQLHGPAGNLSNGWIYHGVVLIRNQLRVLLSSKHVSCTFTMFCSVFMFGRLGGHRVVRVNPEPLYLY